MQRDAIAPPAGVLLLAAPRSSCLRSPAESCTCSMLLGSVGGMKPTTLPRACVMAGADTTTPTGAAAA